MEHKEDTKPIEPKQKNANLLKINETGKFSVRKGVFPLFVTVSKAAVCSVRLLFVVKYS